jgi:ADP-dependent NAD(P)H-hydrate dehydratase
MHEIKSLLKQLPVRGQRSNKSHGGRVWLIAGSRKYPGAAILAATAASRIGAGYVGLSMSGGSQLLNSFEAPDILPLAFKRSVLLEFHPNAVAIGPGLGKTKLAQGQARKVLQFLRQTTQIKVVVDADGLLAIGRGRLPSHWVLTPHSGELARMLRWKVSKVDRDRDRAVREAQRKFGCIVVLKGHRTLIASPRSVQLKKKEVSVFQNLSGNSALAKAGTGDVLTGMIAGLLAQNVEPLTAARLAVWMHGHLADCWVKSGHDHLSLLASDLVRMLPAVLARVRKSRGRALASAQVAVLL